MKIASGHLKLQTGLYSWLGFDFRTVSSLSHLGLVPFKTVFVPKCAFARAEAPGGMDWNTKPENVDSYTVQWDVSKGGRKL